jgi:hypothetical protein
MYGGPSSVDLFDPKPELDRHHGRRMEGKGQVDPFFGSPGPLMRSPYRFARHGRCGAWVSDRLPALASWVDEIAFIKSCRAESNNHAPALYQMNTGLTRMGFPSVGSWTTYGLGSENQNVPGFVVMHDWRGAAAGAPGLWGNGFLPADYQGTTFRTTGKPILNLERADGVPASAQRAQLSLLRSLNREHLDRHPGESELQSRIESFELAYRMQKDAPELTDLSAESPKTWTRYGLDSGITAPFGAQLLLARRMVERGVRFIQVYSGGPTADWDAHAALRKNHDARCLETDLSIAALLSDLKERGLLSSTLVVWGGEFGRLPISQKTHGRDHNPHGFTMWMAGGGVKGGVSYGETDELGYRASENPVSVPDLHATVLHLMGLDHRRLTYRHNGRDFRLTDTSGEVIRPILA